MKYKIGQKITEQEYEDMTKEDFDFMEENNMCLCLGFMKIMSEDDFDTDGDYEFSKQWLTDMEALNTFDLLWYAWINSGSSAIDDILNEAHRDICRMSRKEWNEWANEMNKRGIDFSLTIQEVIE